MASRPKPALMALFVGLLVGFTGGVAASGGESPQGNPPVSVVDASKDKPWDEVDGNSAKAKSRKKRRGSRATRSPREGGSKGFAAAAESAGQVIEESGARAGVTIIPLSGVEVFEAGDTGEYQAWSTMKIPVIATFLDFKPEPTSKDLGDITAAIRQSDNVAVRRLYQQMLKAEDVGGANSKLQTMLAAGSAEISGLPNTIDPGIKSVAFGQSRWSPASAATFFQSLACGRLPLAEANARYVLTQMNQLSAGRWGAVTTFPSDRVFAKGGWGNNGGWTVSQIAIVGRRSGAFVLAMMSEPSSESSGHALLAKIAGAVKRSLPMPKADGRLPGC